jgi:hypothetical protein
LPDLGDVAVVVNVCGPAVLEAWIEKTHEMRPGVNVINFRLFSP